MFEVLLAAEVLPVRVLNPALDHKFIGEVEGVLQVVQCDHQANGHAGTSFAFGVECAEALYGTVPVNVGCEFDQPLVLIHKIDQLGSKQLVLALKLSDFRSHQLPRFRLPLIPFMTIWTPLSSSKH